MTCSFWVTPFCTHLFKNSQVSQTISRLNNNSLNISSPYNYLEQMKSTFVLINNLGISAISYDWSKDLKEGPYLSCPPLCFEDFSLISQTKYSTITCLMSGDASHCSDTVYFYFNSCIYPFNPYAIIQSVNKHIIWVANTD